MAATDLADASVMGRAKPRLANPRIEPEVADQLLRAAINPVATVRSTPVIVSSRLAAGLSIEPSAIWQFADQAPQDLHRACRVRVHAAGPQSAHRQAEADF